MERLNNLHTTNVGFYSSLLLTLLTVVSFGFAMLAVPPSGPFCPGDCMSYPYTDILKYFPRDYLWMYFTFFQLCAFLVFIIANHYVVNIEKKIYSFISVAFSVVSVTVLITNYFLQFSVIPISILKEQKEGIALLTQYNGNGIFIVLEELGFIIMSISFIFLSFVFSFKNRIEKYIRMILMLPLIVTIISFIFYTILYGLNRDYRFEVATISINWIVTIIVGILSCFYFRRKIKILQKEHT